MNSILGVFYLFVFIRLAFYKHFAAFKKIFHLSKILRLVNWKGREFREELTLLGECRRSPSVHWISLVRVLCSCTWVWEARIVRKEMVACTFYSVRLDPFARTCLTLAPRVTTLHINVRNAFCPRDSLHLLCNSQNHPRLIVSCSLQPIWKVPLLSRLVLASKQFFKIKKMCFFNHLLINQAKLILRFLWK